VGSRNFTEIYINITVNNNIFQTDRCVLVAYQPGAGGNFLINSLCFHSQFQPMTRGVFIDHSKQIEFIQQQLDHQIGTVSKESWRDFNMTELDFYGVRGLWYDYNPLTRPFTEIPDKYITWHQQELLTKGSSNVQRCVDQQRYFFKGLHRLMELDACRRLWPNSQTILLVNSQDYIDRRYQGVTAPQAQIVTDISQAQSLVDSSRHWDCDWFLSWTAFIQGYTALLATFDLEPENVTELEAFYRAYINYWFPDLAS
jgi:hypothetical protein